MFLPRAHKLPARVGPHRVEVAGVVDQHVGRQLRRLLGQHTTTQAQT